MDQQQQHRNYLQKKHGLGGIAKPTRFRDAETGNVLWDNTDLFKPAPFFVTDRRNKVLKDVGCPHCGEYVSFGKLTVGIICSRCHEYIDSEQLAKMQVALNKLERTNEKKK